LEALGPVPEGDERLSLAGLDGAQVLLELEREGAILRTRFDGRSAWCERRLLARIHRYTLDTLRREIEPVSAAEFMAFLACWQHVDEGYQLEGPRGLAEVLGQLAGFSAPVRAWEASILSRRVVGYRREWLDELTSSGEFVWGRLWGGGGSAIRVTPISFVAREDLEAWLGFTKAIAQDELSGSARDLLDVLKARGAMFPQELERAARLPPAFAEVGLAELIGHGAVTCDSFAGVRQMITPPSRRRRPVKPVGRWNRFRIEMASPADHAFIARQLLRRTGVVFRRMLTPEKLPVSWSALIRVYRQMELRGEVRGGRFVAGFSGEQFALPEAVERMRRLRREGGRGLITMPTGDPLDFRGILTPEHVAPSAPRQVLAG
jgi:ATP-dependent Lhr-like helicase